TLSKTQSSTGGASAALARASSRSREVVEVRCTRLLQLPCGARQHRSSAELSGPSRLALVPRAATAEPEESDALGAFRTACCPVDPECYDPAPASCYALQRQVSAVRAVCSNPARTDLCGGARLTRVPTATVAGENERPFPPMPIFATNCHPGPCPRRNATDPREL